MKQKTTPVLRGTFIVKFDFETLEEALGSYGLTELESGAERVQGHPSVEEALAFGKKTYEKDPDGPSSFMVLNSFLKPVKTWEPNYSKEKGI